MKDKFVVYLTRRSEREREISLTAFLRALGGYLRKVFYYARAQLRRQSRSYRSMIVVSVVLLSFVFANLILNEVRMTKAMSQAFGGIHHVMLLGVDGGTAKGASEHKGVEECLIIPVIARMPSSVDASTVGKVAVLTEETAAFLQLTMTHGAAPGDNEIIVPSNLYSIHPFLTLGAEQDMYFESDALVYRSMTVGGVYDCTDRNSPYVFVNETAGEAIKAETGHRVTFDVYLILSVASERNAAKVAEELIRQYGVKDTAEQQVYADAASGRSMYRDYINGGAASYRSRNGMSVYRVASMGAVVIAALIMTSFFNDHTARHIGEYGILAVCGAKRRHLVGVVMGQALFVTALSLLPVLLLSVSGAYLYHFLYNQTRAVVIPVGALVEAALWYVAILCSLCVLTLKRTLSQRPSPMLRGRTAGKLPFVRRSSDVLFRVVDKVGYLALLQSLRLVKHQVIPSLATSAICIVCAMFIGGRYLSLPTLTDTTVEWGDHAFDGIITTAIDPSLAHDSLRGYPTTEDMTTLASLDGVKTVGGIRIADEGDAFALLWGGTMTTASPVYCDGALLPYLYSDVREGDPNAVFTTPDSLILVDAAGGSGVHAGDVVTVERRGSGRREMTVAAVVSGTYFSPLDLPLSDGTVIMSSETGAAMDGFPAHLRENVCFMYEEGLTREAYAALSQAIGAHPDLIRFHVTVYETEQLRGDQALTLENGVTAVMAALLYLSLCVLDYTNARERIRAQARELCVLRQLGAGKGTIYKTTRASVYAGQAMAMGFTVAFALMAFSIATGYCANLANMYRMSYGDIGPVIEAMLVLVREKQNAAYGVIGGVLALCIPLHGAALLTAILGTLPPTREILRASVAEVLKGNSRS